MVEKIDLSILIVNYNTKDLTLSCLKSIYEGRQPTFSYEVLLLDNASTDGSVEAIQKAFPRASIFMQKENSGFGRGNNYLAKRAKGTYLLLLNSDAQLMGNALQELYDCYRNHQKEVGFLGPKLLNKDMTAQASAGRFPTIWVTIVWLLFRGDSWGYTRNSPNQFKLVDWVSGACILTTKSHYQALKGFDEDIFMYMEEVDLLYRARCAGLLTAFCPTPKVVHHGSASSAGKTQPILHVYRGLLYFYKKHFSSSSLFFLKCVLQLKALVGYGVGVVVGSSYLKKTYGKALKII